MVLVRAERVSMETETAAYPRVERFVREWKSGFSPFRCEPREIADAG
jgi:hypothetical protein